MPKSKNRKGHKEKVAKYKAEVQLMRKRQKEEALKKYIEMMQAKQSTMKRQVDGEFVGNSDIDIDLDVNLDSVDTTDSNLLENSITDAEIVSDELKESDK
jgi:hypothetical protein